MASDRARGRQSATKKHASADNLPVKLSSFINRESEMAEIKSLLREHRLLTLTGSGGVGKTRCAIQVASQLLDEGLKEVRFVDLSPVRDDNYVASTIASAVDAPSVPVRDPLPALPARLRHRSLLLLLDNCEHVIDGVASAVAAILQGCPGVTILATSRERLAIDGERVYRLPPLGGTHALRLLSERAIASDASFVLTSDGRTAIAAQHRARARKQIILPRARAIPKNAAAKIRAAAGGRRRPHIAREFNKKDHTTVMYAHPNQSADLLESAIEYHVEHSRSTERRAFCCPAHFTTQSK